MEALNDEQRSVYDAVISSTSAAIGELASSLRDMLKGQVAEAVRELREVIIDNAVPLNEQCIAESLTSQEKDIRLMEKENAELRNKHQILEGRLTRAEKEISDLKEQLTMQEARSMQDNLKFYGIKENENENCEETITTFLREKMKINEQDILKIHFDRVHRTGERNKDGKRVIVAKLTSTEGKNLILRHGRNLERHSGYGVSEQLPRVLAERKKQLLPSFKKAKEQQKKPRWSLDKLVVGKSVHTVPKDTVRDVNLNIVEKALLLRRETKHAPPIVKKGNTFQGHRTSVKCQDDIVPALHGLYADSRIARASNNPYAYRIKTSDSVIEHYEDDGEWGAGQKLLAMMKEKDIKDTFLCVSRWSDSKYIGSVRFDLIMEAAAASFAIS